MDYNGEMTDEQERLINKLIQKARQKYNIEITPEDIANRATVRNLMRFLEGGLNVSKTSRPLREKDLKHRFTWSPSSVVKQPLPTSISSILLTGSTGFLGMHLLHELYASTQAKIYVLIRATDALSAQSALRASCKQFTLPDISRSHRIHAVPGDLAKPLLGLDSQMFHILSLELDSIYHLGAYVHHIYDYQALRPVNVFGTQELIKLAMLNRKKLFHYTSSIVAALDQDVNGWFLETLPTKLDCGEIDGYAQTKWVSEKLLKQAHSQGLPITIYRPCNISGRTTDGLCSAHNNHLLRLLKGCLQMGYAPDWPFKLNIMPVDIVSKCIAKISLLPIPRNAVLNITNNNGPSWNHLIKQLNNAGHQINTISEHEWSVKYLPFIDEANALFPLRSLYTDGPNSEAKETPASKNDKYRCEHMVETFRLIDCEIPETNDKLLRTYLSYLYKCGFLEKPEKKPQQKENKNAKTPA